jgi:hypothetical protein
LVFWLVLLTKFFCLADNLVGTPFFEQFGGNSYIPQKGGHGCIKKGACAPLLSEKGVPYKFTIPKLPSDGTSSFCSDLCFHVARLSVLSTRGIAKYAEKAFPDG